MPRRRPTAEELSEQEKWAKRLAEEGMPEELPPAQADCLESSSAISAARAYAQLRASETALTIKHADHVPFINALASQFGIGKGEAQQLLEDALAHADQRTFGSGRLGQ